MLGGLTAVQCQQFLTKSSGDDAGVFMFHRQKSREIHRT